MKKIVYFLSLNFMIFFLSFNLSLAKSINDDEIEYLSNCSTVGYFLTEVYSDNNYRKITFTVPQFLMKKILELNNQQSSFDIMAAYTSKIRNNFELYKNKYKKLSDSEQIDFLNQFKNFYNQCENYVSN